MSRLLEVRNLCKGFRTGEERIEILTELCLDLDEGEMVAITGVSGSGKSTLLHLLGGMEQPDSGQIRCLDCDLGKLSARELSRFRNETIGFVFQFHHLLPEFSALENVMMPLLLRGIPRNEAQKDGVRMLAEVGLAQRSDHRPGELSGGEQQRVAIARGLAGKPRLLLADEPTGNLDPHTGDAVGALFVQLHHRYGLTSILVTHNEKLAGLCSRIYRLEDGRLQAIRP